MELFPWLVSPLLEEAELHWHFDWQVAQWQQQYHSNDLHIVHNCNALVDLQVSTMSNARLQLERLVVVLQVSAMVPTGRLAESTCLI